MLTSASRFRCALACGALWLAPAACSVDERTLSASRPDGDGGADNQTPDGFTSGAVANESGASGDPGPGEEGLGGASSDEPSCAGDQGERHCTVAGGDFLLDPESSRVPAKVSTFALDELEVTVGRFRKYVESFPGVPDAGAGAHPQIEHSGWRSEWDALLPASPELLSASLHCNFDWETWSDEPAEREDYPLTCASYYVAFAFCAWSGGRLPTEAEWEYAAAGGDQQRLYPWGSDEPSSELALFQAPKVASAGGHRSGRARFGQLDMAGSAWEWTLDLYRPYPDACENCAELDSGFDRVLRGGAFIDDAAHLKIAYRHHTDPQLALGEVGFRCAFDL